MHITDVSINNLKRVLIEGDIITLNYQLTVSKKVVNGLPFVSVDECFGRDVCRNVGQRCHGYCIRHGNEEKGHGYCLDLDLVSITITERPGGKINKVTEIN